MKVTALIGAPKALETNRPGHNVIVSIADAHDRALVGNIMHEMHAKHLSDSANMLKTLQVVLTTLTTCSALSVIFGETHVGAIVTGVLAAFALGVELTQLRFDISPKIKRHDETAFALWRLRERYSLLHSEVMDKTIGIDVLREKYEALLIEKESIFEKALPCAPKFYEPARAQAKSRLLRSEEP